MQYFTQQPSFLCNNLKAMIQGEYAPYTALKFYCFFILIGIPSFLLAQLHQFPAIYPALPFEIQKASALGYNKCTVWEGIYRKTESDQSGYIWSTIEQESHQSKKFVFFEGVLDIVSNYAPSGDKVWTMEYFYKQGLLSAIERLSYDSLQESSLEYAYAYLYRFDSIPFQRVKMFGFPNKKLRLLEEFDFDIVFVQEVSIFDEKSIETLKEKLFTLNASTKQVENFFRYYVDRAFSPKGIGTVVTGTVLGKKLELNEKVFISQAQKESKIKNIQVHNENTLEANISNRAALNLQGINSTNIKKQYQEMEDLAKKCYDSVINKIKNNPELLTCPENQIKSKMCPGNENIWNKAPSSNIQSTRTNNLKNDLNSIVNANNKKD